MKKDILIILALPSRLGQRPGSALFQPCLRLHPNYIIASLYPSVTAKMMAQISEYTCFLHFPSDSGIRVPDAVRGGGNPALTYC